MKRFAFLALLTLLTMSCLLQGATMPLKQSVPTEMPETPEKAPTGSPVGAQAYVLPFCVNADETVYLRSTPNTSNYPLGVLERGEKVYPNGGITDEWLEVETALGNGWVNRSYVGTCLSKTKNLYDRSENTLE